MLRRGLPRPAVAQFEEEEVTLSENPRAILMRRLRARRRENSPRKAAGRKTDYSRLEALVAAYEAAEAIGDYRIERLRIREEYVSRDSLRKGYLRAKRKIAERAIEKE